LVSWLERAIKAREPFTIGQVRVEPLRTGWRLLGQGDGGRTVDPAELASFVRHDAAGRYRPLSGARTLPAGWQVTAADDAGLLKAIEALYPLATRHVEMDASGELRTVPLAAVLERQSGRYRASAELSDAGRALAVEVVCDECVRTPVWDAGPRQEEASIPCPEACSVLVAFCREAALWEAEPPDRRPPDHAVGFAEFETSGNALREAYLARRG
jgi:sirohydrochlorin cobaltochelatase